jgi:hypothetical protein
MPRRRPLRRPLRAPTRTSSRGAASAARRGRRPRSPAASRQALARLSAAASSGAWRSSSVSFRDALLPRLRRSSRHPTADLDHPGSVIRSGASRACGPGPTLTPGSRRAVRRQQGAPCASAARAMWRERAALRRQRLAPRAPRRVRFTRVAARKSAPTVAPDCGSHADRDSTIPATCTSWSYARRRRPVASDTARSSAGKAANKRLLGGGVYVLAAGTSSRAIRG